jgi:DNA ligase-associated metallophosphoesterase
VLIHCQGEELELLPERAIFWPARKTLFIADLHLGKSRHFQKSGIAVSNELETADLEILMQLVCSREVEHCIVLGDFLHSFENRSTQKFLELVTHSGVKFSVVPGNHDRFIRTNSELMSALVWLAEKHEVKPFTCMHDAEMKLPGEFALAGHIHPSVLLKGFGKQNLQLPCFWVSNEFIILPAFSLFTGTFTIKPETQDSIYVIADSKVIKVN